VLARTKTDRVDAQLMARFCAAHHPAAWQPPVPQRRELQALVARGEALNHRLTQETNRLAIAPTWTRGSIEQVIAVLAEELAALKCQIRHHIDHHPDLRAKHTLLQSIPGIGEATIAQTPACVGGAESFKRARKLAAFLGLTPRPHLSGCSVRGRARLSKAGNARLRKALFMPAMVAIRFNPVSNVFAARLRAAGKSRMLLIGAGMRKLVHLVFGALKSGQLFTANFGVQQI
jgi:transposase